MSYSMKLCLDWPTAGELRNLFRAATFVDYYPVHVVPSRRRLFLFRECQSLSYNLRFGSKRRKNCGDVCHALLYQRHGVFFVGPCSRG